MHATKEQFDAVMAAINTASESFLPAAAAGYRYAVFAALYKLAIKGTIPIEIDLTVEVLTDPETGAWTLKFSQALMDWLAVR